MATINLRAQLQAQLEKLPDDLVEQIADFTLFVMAQQNIKPDYANWDERDWQSFSLQQFFSEEDEVEYTLNDAKEIYRA